MKRFWFVILAAGTGFVLNAQTNAPVPTTNAPPAVGSKNALSVSTATQPAFTTIRSETGNFDFKTHVMVYRGNVRVNDPQLKMTCDVLTVYLPAQAGGRPDRIVADKHVVIDFTDEKGQTNHATGDQAVYTYNVTSSETNELVELTGNAELDNQSGIMTGEPIIWDRTRGTLSARNQKMEFRTAVAPAIAPTNLLSSPQTSTNISSPTTSTNE